MVEDHILVRQGIRSVLEGIDGIEVVAEAGDGQAAIDLAGELRPDVVLMDIGLPLVNGLEATRRIKLENPRAIVLVVTAYDDDAYIFALLEAGAAGYLLKTAPAEELAAAIHSVFKGESVLSPAVVGKVMARFAQAEPGQNGSPLALSEAELEVLRLAASGLPNRGIAEELSLSPRMVQLHFERLFEKLDVASRTEAVVVALKKGWLQLEELH
jgi:DNA-binding NarL/FixJ family response regulator